MYADDSDDFVKSDISGVVDACRNVSDKLSLTWCKRLPREFNGVTIATEYILLDTKRSASNYVNVIKHHTAQFCLDNRPNAMNAFLLEQATRVHKTPIRLAEYLSKGSTTILDCGDHHVVGRFEKGVLLHRLMTQTDLPTGKHFAHPSEAQAETLLKDCFTEEHFYVNYEPFTLNFSDDSAVIDGCSVHCYNVDFRVRKKTSSCNVGVEVKCDLSSWEWKKSAALVKIKKYERIMGAPCLVLIMNPSPRFYFVGDTTIQPFSSHKDVVAFVHDVSDAAVCANMSS